MKYLVILILLVSLLSGCAINDPTAIWKGELHTYDIPNNTAVVIMYYDREALVVNDKGTFRSFMRYCPVHPQYKPDEKFICPQSTFNFDGSPSSGQAIKFNSYLEEIPVVIKNETIILT